MALAMPCLQLPAKKCVYGRYLQRKPEKALLFGARFVGQKLHGAETKRPLLASLAFFSVVGIARGHKQRRHTSLVKRFCSGPRVREALASEFSSVLEFWFGAEFFDSPTQLDDEQYLRSRTKIWYRGGAMVDAKAKDFLPLLRRECRHIESAGRPLSVDSSEVSELNTLARIILFDQVSRNAARGTAEAFQQDDIACELSEALIADGYADKCRAAELLFLAQPLVHTETPPDGSRANAAMDILRRQMSRFPRLTAQRLFQANLSHEKHLTILQRFGRYPHRNSLLCRQSTEEELEWLSSSDCPGWAWSQLPRVLRKK
eukprot:TRINITY_DN44443_c0_g1_i1.p1 TRINITY_DN44443_c0_g1~~TRINITY_DN44443_c0_g1_i1.p1  ORF type:complete len:317 (-),score=40.01 TRINITY_DN44443_c0_g1_i1:190-1140(-)